MSAQGIFEQLRRAGCTVTGALALMGNWQCESGLEACRVQGDFYVGRQKSRDYADRIDHGLISDEEWCKDSKGWGLAQWTFWSRKEALLQFCRRRSVSIADEKSQVDFAVSELKTGFSVVWNALTSAGEEDLYTTTDLVCRRYEAPAYNNVQERVNAALDLKRQLQEKAVEQIDNGIERFWPPRMICNGMNGADVTALQALLTAHGYIVPVNGVFSDSTEKAVRKFQSDRGLDVDGVVGPKTWAELTKI